VFSGISKFGPAIDTVLKNTKNLSKVELFVEIYFSLPIRCLFLFQVDESFWTESTLSRPLFVHPPFRLKSESSNLQIYNDAVFRTVGTFVQNMVFIFFKRRDLYHFKA